MINTSPEYPKQYMCTPVNRNHKQQATDPTNEQSFITSISQMAQQILHSLRNDKEQYEKRITIKQKQYMSNAEQQEKMIAELIKQNEELSTENNQLRMKLDQSLRHLKRNQMKVQLLNNKIRLVSHELTEKEAVIKYLESKTQDHNHYSKKVINHSLNNISVSLDESLSSFRSKDLSFAKLKETKIKFQDFANSSTQFLKQPQESTGFKNKTKRIRTESSYEVKENRNQDNINYKSKADLNEFLSNKFWGNSHDKTLAKKMRHNSSSCWIVQSTKEGVDPANQRRSMNFNSSAYFYTRPEHTYIPSQLSLNAKHSLN